MQRLATALVACTLASAGCSSDAARPDAADSSAAATQTSQPQSSPKAGAAGAPAMGAASSSSPAAGDTKTKTKPASMMPASTPSASSMQPSAAAAASSTSSSAMPAAASGMASETTASAMPAKSEKKLAMNECDLHSGYAGDEYCIKPPPADKGFQLHIGPADYKNPGADYILQPGEENVVDMSGVSGNDKMVYYYYRQYRMRPGSHHVIVTTNGRRLGGTQNLAKDNPDFGDIPPENEHIGLPLDAHAPLNANMHYYNFTDKPIIRELWVNFWYKDAADVTDSAKEIFSPTGVSAAVAHSHVVVGASCPVTGDGRVLSLYGHRHLNNVRFSVWRTRGSDRQLVLEDYESEHPSVFEFNSLATNPMPDPKAKIPGAFSGILDIKTGDTMDFECEIINMTDKNFTGQNEAKDDEMCIMVGDGVGATIQPFCTPLQAKMIN